MHIKGQVTPVEAELRERGVVHGGGGGVLYRMAIDRAKARAGAEFSRCGHAADSRCDEADFKGEILPREDAKRRKTSLPRNA